MKSILSLLSVCAIAVTGLSSKVQASVYYWEDAETKVSISVPDTWRQVSNQKPDDVLTFLAPGQNEHAACRLRVRPDRRFVIYPQRYSGEIQRLHYSKEFWNDYVGEYDGAILHDVYDNSGLGRGFASHAKASFLTGTGLKMQKQGLMFASLYNDKAYILECSAQEAAYGKFEKYFLSVAKSIDFRKEIHELPTGHYRPFYFDKPLIINGEKSTDVSVH